MLGTKIDDLRFDQFGGVGIGERITCANHPHMSPAIPLLILACVSIDPMISCRIILASNTRV
jgi:hypothetical protein